MKKKTTTRKPATKKPVKRVVTKAPKKTAGKTSKKTTCRTAKKKTAPKTTAKPKATAKNNVTKTKKTEKRDEFRMHKNNGHPSYIYEKVGNKYKFIGITHSQITNNIKNIQLQQNPNPKDSRKAYARPVAKQDKVKKFKKEPLKNWKMGEADKQKIKPLTK